MDYGKRAAERQLISVEVIDEDEQHFCLYFGRPGRSEISVVPSTGQIIVHVYDGAEVDPDQIPLGAYDGSIDNQSWEA